MIRWKVGIFRFLPVPSHLDLGLWRCITKTRESTQKKCYVSVCLSVFTISNLTTVENWCSDLLLPCCRSWQSAPRTSRAGGGGAERRSRRRERSKCGGEGRGKERREEKRMTGDDLWIISLLSLHRLIHKGCLCVCQSVCGRYYKSPVQLADTLSRLSHHVLLLLPM